MNHTAQVNHTNPSMNATDCTSESRRNLFKAWVNATGGLAIAAATMTSACGAAPSSGENMAEERPAALSEAVATSTGGIPPVTCSQVGPQISLAGRGSWIQGRCFAGTLAYVAVLDVTQNRFLTKGDWFWQPVTVGSDGTFVFSLSASCGDAIQTLAFDTSLHTYANHGNWLKSTLPCP